MIGGSTRSCWLGPRASGAPSKPEYVLGGRRLVDGAVRGGCGAAHVLVGPGPAPEGVLLTREDPLFGAPWRGLRLAPRPSATMPRTVLLACDPPEAEVGWAVSAAEPGPEDDGVCLIDADGRLQWLLGCYRTQALARRLSERGDPPLTAMYRLLEPLHLLGIPADRTITDDIDTPADAARWTAHQEDHA